ncbi:hypothetical protein [Ruminococcus sp. FC2018]|uniref:hypothetical protein n=1 Tax=Ruminococcus sp. FC2018 TaxID=1410617 RepID=UPI00048AF1B2|nr:hypothetical protein [Ruminococcus sp. FC2018]
MSSMTDKEKNAAEQTEEKKGSSNSNPELSQRAISKLRKKKNKERKREIKHILVGSYFTLDDGRMASGGGKWVSPLGVGDGAGSALLLGIKDKSFRYSTRLKNSTQVLHGVSKAMKDIGRELSLDCAADARACYIKSVVFRPVVLLFEEVIEQDRSSHFELHAYCGRSPLSFLSIRRAVSRLDKQLPDTISRV